MSEEKTVARLGLPWSVGIVVGLSLIPGMLFGKFNFTLWVCFIAWAEYFVFGAAPKAFKILIPCWLYGTLMAAFWMAMTVFVANYTTLFWAAFATNFIALPLLMWGCKFHNFGECSLAVFGGFTCFLALYFTGVFPKQLGLDATVNPYLIILITIIWDLLMGYIGHFFGWLTIALTFPHKVPAASTAASSVQG